MKKIYYEKVGRKYIPVSEYDSDFLDSMGKGTHLIMCYPGGKSKKYNIEPNYAALIAASRVAQDIMTKAIVDASEIRRNNNMSTPLTSEQKAAWDNLITVFGESARYLSWPSAHDIAEAGIKALQDEADKLLSTPSVKIAYEQFQLIAAISKNN